MKYNIHKTVVIGAGTMGAAIAAHLANAGVMVTLLDIVPRELTPEEAEKGLTLQDRSVRNRIVNDGLQRAIKSRPASFFTPEHATLVSVGNLEDDFEVITEADWVIEVIIENLKIKQNLMARIDEIRAPNTIVSTNTSGIPVSSIAQGRSDGFRKHFLGTHFFNPPRYLKLLEIIPTHDTSSEVKNVISRFCEYSLGKGIVECKDTPNFIANRIFAATAAFTMDYVLEHGYSVEEVDAITGPPIGNPKTATFRLFDLVGLDVWEHVGKNLAPTIPDDAHALRYITSQKVIDLIRSMVERGWYGTKVNQGFYKEVRDAEGKKGFWPLNLQTMEHVPPQKPRFESIGKVKDEEDLGKRLEILVQHDDRAGELVKATTYQMLAYSSERIPEIADNPQPIDDAMRWGFGREAGPFEIWDMLGVKQTSEAMANAGFQPAAWVFEMLSSGVESFYEYKKGVKQRVYNPIKQGYEDIEKPAGMILLNEQRSAGKVLKENPGAALIDLDDGVLCVEFHTKGNSFDQDVVEILIEGLDRVERDYEGLVVGNEGENFSTGANIFMAAVAAQNEMWDQIESFLKLGQDMHMRMRYFPKPVIVAPAGMALGGGAEIVMHASRVVASVETYIGLVEMGIGVIPSWGGVKEMLRRVLNPPMRTNGTEPLSYLQRIFEQIGLAKVAMSAEEARKMGILHDCDRVVMNRDLLLAEAKKEVLHLREVGYHPPLPEKIFAAGRDAFGALKVGIHMMKEGGYITEYESHLAQKLAYVMTGGMLSKPSWVDEQHILDLEREAFISLCGEKKTQERMWHMLQKRKPLRN
jgi:3-hydroxyacyl-CoA dehydrogenase